MSVIVILCGQRVNCSNNTESWQDDPTDPDIAGIGVMLSFIITATASTLAIILAYVNRGIPDQQYTHLDDRLIARFDKCWKRTSSAEKIVSNDVTGYQAFLLALGDQFVVTGIGIMIALYSQMCSLTSFSFHVGMCLAYFSLGVHLNTLTALRIHFKKNPVQRKIRVLLMSFSAIFLLLSKLLDYLTWSYDPERLWACTLVVDAVDQYEYGLGWVLWDWAALCLGIWYTYSNAILSNLPTHKREKAEWREAQPLWLRLLARISTTRGARRVRTYMRQREEKHDDADAKRLRDLTRILDKDITQQWQYLSQFFKVFWLIAPDLFYDVFNSLIMGILINLFWFGMAIKDFISTLKYGHVDLKPLLEWKFGQVMPMLLLLVFGFSAVEAHKSKSSIKQHTQTSAVPRMSPAPRPKASTTSSRSSMEMTDFGGDLASQAEFERVPGYAPVWQRTSNPVEQRVVSLVLGEPSRLDVVPTPVITAGFDGGSQPSRPEGETEIDLLDEAGKRCKIYVNICVYVLLVLIAGWVVFMYFFFTYAVTILAICDVGWMTYTLIRICRIRKEDMADTMRLLDQEARHDA